MTRSDAELAQEIRHIAEMLGGVATLDDYQADLVDGAVDDLHDLAERLDPGSSAKLDAYIIEEVPDGSDDIDS